MDSKEIKMAILSNKLDDKKLELFLRKEFKNTIQALFNALFVLMRDPNKNSEKINNYLNKIATVINNTEEKEKLNIISKKIEDVLTRVDNHLNKKNSQEIKNILIQLRQLMILTKEKKYKKNNNTTTIILETLIYEDHDLVKLEVILNRQRDLFKPSSRKKLFADILSEYIKLDEKEETANYYFKLISLILSSNNRYHILANKEEYLQILDKAKKHNKTITIIKNKFNKNYITTTKELEFRYDMSFTFPKNMNEINNYDKQPAKSQNFIKFPSITIDDEGNKCNDDAIYLAKNHDGTYTLRIDIASVPAIIPHMSYLDMQAYKRSEAIYLSDMTIPIYPEYIAYDKGSLLENNIRNVLSYIYLVDSNFDVIEDSFQIVSAKTLISNNLSYKQANILLKNERCDELSQMLKKLSFIASKLGNTNSSSVSIIDSRKMIEKFMKLPSKSISAYCKKEGIPLNYRVYQKLNEEKRRQIQTHYHNINNNPDNELLKIIEEKSSTGFYSDKPLSHESFGSNSYAKVTSPLRSYPSTINEYIIYDFIINKKYDNQTIDKWNSILKEAVPYMNERIKMNNLFCKEYEQIRAKTKILRR